MIDNNGEFNWLVLTLSVISICALMVFIASQPYGNEGSSEPAVAPVFPAE